MEGTRLPLLILLGLEVRHGLSGYAVRVCFGILRQVVVVELLISVIQSMLSLLNEVPGHREQQSLILTSIIAHVYDLIAALILPSLFSSLTS